MTSAFSTITNNVNLLLVDTSVVGSNKPYVAYVSSVSIPGRIATIRDSTGYLSSANQQIIISSTKDILFNFSTSSISITQPFGFVSLISRDKNTWNVINNYAFPGPTVANVSSIYVNDFINAQSYFASQYVSTPYVNTSNISSHNLVASNSISTNILNVNSISTNNLQVQRSLIVPTGFISTLSTNSAFISFVSSANILVNSISSLSLQTNVISTNSINTNAISTPNILTNSISTTNLRASTISTTLLFGTNISSINLQASNILTNYITTTGITTTGFSTNNILVNSISTNNLQASTISTILLFANTISTNSITTNSISTPNLLINSISTNNLQANTISTNLLLAPSISTFNLFTTNIQTANISSININTNNISTNNISTNYLFASNISTINLRASTISTNLLFSRFVSSLQMQTSSIILKSGTSPGYLYASDDGQTLFLNSTSVGTWVSKATSDLNMCNYNINNANTVNMNTLQFPSMNSIVGNASGLFIQNNTNFGNNNINNINNLATASLNINNKTILGSNDLSGVYGIFSNIDIYNLTVQGVSFNVDPFSLSPPVNFDLSGQRLLNVYQTQTITDGATNKIIPQIILQSNVQTNNITLSPTFTRLYGLGTFFFHQPEFTIFSVNINFKGKTNNNSNTGTIYLYATLSNTQEITGNTFTSAYPYEYTQNGLQPTRISFSYTDIFDTTGYTPWSSNATIAMSMYMCTTNTNFVGSYFNTVNVSVTIAPIIYNLEL